MQAAKESIKSKRAERMLRVMPLIRWIDLCHELLGNRMLPKWLQAVKSKGEQLGGDAISRCEVLQSPEYWVFNKYSGVGQFVLQYK